MRIFLLALSAAGLLSCQSKAQSALSERVICDISEQDIKQFADLTTEQLDEKYGHCDLTSFAKINPVYTTEHVELINKQVAFELGLLGYNKALLEDPVPTENIKGFQKALGEPQSGRLTQRQLGKAVELAEKKIYFDVRLPLSGNGTGPYIGPVSADSENLRLAGTWEVETSDCIDTRRHRKFNYWEYKCDKASLTCSSINMDFRVTHEFVGMNQFKRKDYDVRTWDDGKIVFVNRGAIKDANKTPVVTVDLRTGTIKKVTPLHNCKSDAPEVLQLKGSWELGKKLNAERAKESPGVYTGDYMALKAATK